MPGANATVTLDFFHACDYLVACAKSPVFVEDRRWFETQKESLRQGKSAELIALLEKHVEDQEVADEQAPIRTAHRYFSNRSEQLDYATALGKGLPIGSGLIEGAHRHVLQKHLKLSGAWWERNNLKHMVALRTSGQINNGMITGNQSKPHKFATNQNCTRQDPPVILLRACLQSQDRRLASYPYQANP